MKIPVPPVDERKKVIEEVDKDRRYTIDAAIVRIMKSRKVLGLQQLVIECVEQLSNSFKVQHILLHMWYWKKKKNLKILHLVLILLQLKSIDDFFLYIYELERPTIKTLSI